MRRKDILVLISGILVGAFVVGTFIATSYLKDVIQVIQALTITLATIFTAWWTSKTFAHNAKASEAKELIESITKLQIALGNVAYQIPVYELMAATTQSETADIEISRIRSEANLAMDNLELVTDKSIYLTPVLRLQLMNAKPMKIEIVNKESLKEINSKLIRIKFQLIEGAHFDLGWEFRKLKKYLGFLR